MTRQTKYNRTPKGKYVAHKASAKWRGVEFNLTFEQWMELWSPHLEERGIDSGSYQMCRFNDEGDYSVDNVYMATLAQNRYDTKKLDSKTVEYIREVVALKERTQISLARELGVSHSTISFAVNRKGVYQYDD